MSSASEVVTNFVRIICVIGAGVVVMDRDRAFDTATWDEEEGGAVLSYAKRGVRLGKCAVVEHITETVIASELPRSMRTCSFHRA